MDQANAPVLAVEGPPRETAKYVGGPGQRDARFGRRAAARDLARRAQSDLGWPVLWRRVTQCGFCAGQLVEIRGKGEDVYPAGVMTCGSVWVCAVCGAKVRTRRGLEVEAAAATWTVMHDGQLAMLTLTVRHFERMPLELVRRAVSDGWRKLQMRKEWRALRSMLSGTVKGLEVTHGRNGWHVHVHLLMFVDRDSSVSEVERLSSELYGPWADLSEQVLGVAPDDRHGVHLLWLDAVASKYVSKIGAEITRSDMKAGATRSPLEFLDDVGRGDLDAMRLFNEYGNGMFRAHALDFSPGLRKLLSLEAEKSDEELAAQVEDGEVICFVDGREWNRMMIERGADGRLLVTAYLERVRGQWLAERR